MTIPTLQERQPTSASTSEQQKQTKPGASAGQTPTTNRPVAFIVAVVLFAVANVFLSTKSFLFQPSIDKAIMAQGAETNGHNKPWTWWLAREYMKQDKAPDVVLFGSSQMGSAMCASDAQHLFQVIDALTHRRAATLEDEVLARTKNKVSIFSLASPGAMCSDALMASRALFSSKLTPRIVVLSLAPRDFIDNTMPYPAATEPYRFYSQYTSPGALLTSSYVDAMSWLQFGIDSLPFKKLGGYLQATVNYCGQPAGKKLTAAEIETEKSAKAGGTAPMAAILGGSAVPNTWNVPANIPKDLWADNTREYKNRFRNPNTPVYACERKFYSQFLQDMRNRGVKVVVVGMPSLPMNRALLSPSFWQEFRSMLSSQCTEYGASFLDLTDNPMFIKSDYLDTVHLNAWGGQKLFASIAEHISKDPVTAPLLRAHSASIPAQIAR
jgi:hypothetical protein